MLECDHPHTSLPLITLMWRANHLYKGGTIEDQGMSPEGRPVAMGWHGVANATPGQVATSFCHPYKFFYN